MEEIFCTKQFRSFFESLIGVWTSSLVYIIKMTSGILLKSMISKILFFCSFWKWKNIVQVCTIAITFGCTVTHLKIIDLICNFGYSTVYKVIYYRACNVLISTSWDDRCGWITFVCDFNFSIPGQRIQINEILVVWRAMVLPGTMFWWIVYRV